MDTSAYHWVEPRFDRMAHPPIPRCALVVPASHPRMVARALASGADEVVLDLEDAVAPEAKDAARAAVVEVLEGDAAPSLAVRINQVGTPWCHRDVLAVADARARDGRAVTLVVPKVESAADVGFADLAADLGRDPGADPTLWDVVRHQVVVAARAAGRAVIDGPWLGTAADDAFTRDRERARALGFDGTWVIHPAQVEAATLTYSPSAEQLDWAERIVSALEHSVAGGAGAVALDGQMLDEAVAVRARAV